MGLSQLIFREKRLKTGMRWNDEAVQSWHHRRRAGRYFFCGDAELQKTMGLFVCPGGKFLVELKLGAQSAGLLPYCNIKGGAQMAENIAAQLAAQKADLLIALSAADEKFFKKLLQKYYPYTKVLHISDAPGYFYEH